MEARIVQDEARRNFPEEVYQHLSGFHIQHPAHQSLESDKEMDGAAPE
jgi:hypothetical protein